MILPTDLAARIRRRIRSKATRLRYRLGWPTLGTGRTRLAEGFRHPIDATNKPALLSRHRQVFADAGKREVEEAQRLLRHQFRLLGHAMDHGRSIDWSRDPVSGKDWERRFSADIPYRGPDRLGDIKLPWELNKHQYFFTLGKAAWLSGDPRYAQEIIAQIDHWIQDNPCHSGIHWISALEAGTRVNSWILAYPFFAEHGDSAFIDRMVQSIAQHVLFVEQNLSLDKYPNTHLAGEAAVLVIGGLFVDCRHSKRWVTTGLHHLETQIHQQVRVDGVHAEQSTAYHRFFLDQYYLVNAILRANARSLSPDTLARMERMTQFLMDVLYPNGTAPAFGDCDDARGIWCRADAPKDFRSLLALGALTFSRGDFKMVAQDPTEELLWLHGDRSLHDFAQIQPCPPDHSSIAYADAGYYVMRGGWNSEDPVLVFDCGPLGHGLAGHGHADALSFQLFARGYPFLVDPGTYSYNLDYEWRNRFRSTRAHNTVTIDGLDQSTPRDRMSWLTAANLRCNRWVTTSWFDLVDGEHDGYRRFGSPVGHRRILAFVKPDVWVVCDLLVGEGEHRWELFLHLPPDCNAAVDAQKGCVALSSPWSKSLRILIEQDAMDDSGRNVPVCEAVEDWHSNTYGEKIKTHAVRASDTLRGSTTVRTSLTTSTEVIVDVAVSRNTLDIVARRPGQAVERLLYPLHGAQHIQEEQLQFEGGILFQRGENAATDVLWANDVTNIVVRNFLAARCQTALKSLTFNDRACALVCERMAIPEIKVPAGVETTIMQHQ